MRLRAWWRRRKAAGWVARGSNALPIGFALYAAAVAAILVACPAGEVGFREEFLSSAIQATAAIIGITVAIFVLVIQHTASSYTPTVLKKFRWDPVLWLAIGFGLLTMLTLGLDLLLAWDGMLLNAVYFFSMFGPVVALIIHTFRRIDPVSIVHGVTDEMVKHCTELAMRGEPERPRPVLVRDDSTRDTDADNLREKIIRGMSTMRQITSVSIKKGDYDTCRECFDAYAKVIREYLKSIHPFYPKMDAVMRTALDDLEHYGELGGDGNKFALPHMIKTYEVLGNTFADHSMGSSEIRSIPSVPLRKCMSSVQKLGVKFAIRDEPALAKSVLRCMGAIGDRACSTYVYNMDMAKGIVGILVTSILHKSHFSIALNAMVSSLQIAESLIHNMSDLVIIRQNIMDLKRAMSSFQRSDRCEQIDYDILDDMYLVVGGCIMESVLSVTRTSIVPGRALGIGRTSITLIVNLVGKIGLESKQRGDLPMKELAMKCLGLIAWLLASEPAGGRNDRYGEEMDRVADLMGKIHDKGSDLSIAATKEVLTTAVRSCIYGHDNAFEKLTSLAIGIISEYDRDHVDDDILASLYLIGCCALGAGKEGHSRRVAEFLLSLEGEDRQRHDAEPLRGALARRVTSYHVSPVEKTSYLAGRYESVRATQEMPPGLISGDNIDKFVAIKEGLTP